MGTLLQNCWCLNQEEHLPENWTNREAKISLSDNREIFALMRE
jgi:hypothetical protein